MGCIVKAKKLQVGDKVAIISLSSGILGEAFMSGQKELIEQRLAAFGLNVIYTPNALKGLDYIKEHPEARAADLKWAFAQDDIKMILCAIGGRDTYRTVPYLMTDQTFIDNVRNHPKIFMGYSDTTVNHLMFQKLGLVTYYGPCAIVDFGELDKEMLPYTKAAIEDLFTNDVPTITSSPYWYYERTDFSAKAIGTKRKITKETHGFEVLHGHGIVKGQLFGGCLESFGDLLLGDQYEDEAEICQEYHLVPTDNTGKVLFLETSEEKPKPDRVREILRALDRYGFFSNARALLVGKPQDEQYYEEYRAIYTELGRKLELPILFNLNVGHAHPRCILPIGEQIEIDFDHKQVRLLAPLAR